ncbi:hypothetical protein PR048_023993 [Dryococelus australis]|uniref:Uncharacterized protein n=1 Tax=Dryococelus australis TaxID=614101 RepID=A0ABQ9GVT4_9NEOP|nr:hypothetical protein PR048_023993 [Dryococelus australis]
MQNDHMKALAEKQMKRVLKGGPIYLPTQWITVMQSTKVTGSPFEINEMDTANIYNLKQMCISFGSNFSINENGENVLRNEIKEINVEREEHFKINYKLRNEGSRDLAPAYTQVIGISAAKTMDLLLQCEAKDI